MLNWGLGKVSAEGRVVLSGVIEFMGSHWRIAGVWTMLIRSRWVERPDERSLGVCFCVWKMAVRARARMALPCRPGTPRRSLKSPPENVALERGLHVTNC